MRKRVWSVFLLLFIVITVLVLAGGCKDKEPPRTLTEENVAEWFEERREDFEAVIEQILLYSGWPAETDMKSFEFEKNRKNVICVRNGQSSSFFGWKAMLRTLEEGPLKETLKATRLVEADSIRVYREHDVDEMGNWGDYTITFSYLIDKIDKNNYTKVYITYKDSGEQYSSDWKELGGGWFYYIIL